MSEVFPLYRVLFVCTGNTCRSPLAAAALRQALGEEGQRVEIASAGVMAADGAPASVHAVEAARKHNLDLRAHRAQRLASGSLEVADLVVAMDTAALETVRRVSPAAAARTHLITDLGADRPSGSGIPDPFGGSVEAYEECLRRITEHVARIAPIVRREVRFRAEADAASGDRGVV